MISWTTPDPILCSMYFVERICYPFFDSVEVLASFTSAFGLAQLAQIKVLLIFMLKIWIPQDSGMTCFDLPCEFCDDSRTLVQQSSALVSGLAQMLAFVAPPDITCEEGARALRTALVRPIRAPPQLDMCVPKGRHIWVMLKWHRSTRLGACISTYSAIISLSSQVSRSLLLGVLDYFAYRRNWTESHTEQHKTCTRPKSEIFGDWSFAFLSLTGLVED